MAALRINRNIISVESDPLQFLHSKLRAVSELSEPSKHDKTSQHDENRVTIEETQEPES